MPQTQVKTSLEGLLATARRNIEVEPAELVEARKRRDAIVGALRQEFPGGRSYVNGSIAHGDALNPLTDVDLGIVVPDPDEAYGPGKRGPADLMNRAADAIRDALRDEYDGLRVEVEGRKRSVLVRFRDPVTPGQPDFTADVIVAIDNVGDIGLYIPKHKTWDRSHPEMHTTLVVDANKRSNVSYARVVRLVKHWMRTHDKPLCSWNVKALALMSNTTEMSHVDGLRAWFANAVAEISRGDTPDPAGVSPDIRLNNVTRSEAVRLLTQGLEHLDNAIEHERHGRTTLAWYELAKFFKDDEVLQGPNHDDVLHAQAEHLRDVRRNAPGLAVGVGQGQHRPQVAARSWGA